MTRANHSPLFVAQALLESRYKGADALFLAGSVIRGEANAYSDIDLVVLYPKVDRAFRESFYHLNWPVEAFVHDPETLRHFFFEVDKPTGTATLAEMVCEGHEVPGASPLSTSVKALAQMVLGDGPPALTPEQIEDRRYHLSELLDDIRDPRTRQELFASASVIYQEMSDCFLRSRKVWSSAGKGVLKRMKKTDPVFTRRFLEAFDLLYSTGRPERLVELGEEFLSAQGGLLFEGYRRDAPPSWRKR